MSQDFARRIAFTVATIAVVLGTHNGIAYASDPSYEPRHTKGFKATTGYSLSEAGVRRALENLSTLGFDESLRVIAVVGERGYTSLTPFLHAIIDVEPWDPDAAHADPDLWWRHPIFLNDRQARAVRSLILCNDPGAPMRTFELAARLPEMNVTAGLYTIRNIKYLLHYPDVDVVAALKAIAESYDDKDHRFAREAGLELAELEHYFRLSLDPRKKSCSEALDELLKENESARRFQVEVENLRNNRPRWSKSYELHKAVVVAPDEYPILVEILEYIFHP